MLISTLAWNRKRIGWSSFCLADELRFIDQTRDAIEQPIPKTATFGETERIEATKQRFATWDQFRNGYRKGLMFRVVGFDGLPFRESERAAILSKLYQ